LNRVFALKIRVSNENLTLNLLQILNIESNTFLALYNLTEDCFGVVIRAIITHEQD